MNSTTTNAPPPRIERHDVRLLWYFDFWDGPINGLCLYNNNKCWFEMWDDEAGVLDTAPRRYRVFAISPQEAAEEERWHELFRQHVGTHCDFEELQPEVKPKEFHHVFYDAFKLRPTPDYAGHPVLGWFETI